MTEEQAGSAVHDLGDLSAGDVIEAWYEGRRYNRGKVLVDGFAANCVVTGE